MIKNVTFRFPFNKDGKTVNNISFDRQTTDTPVETIVLLSKKNTEDA